MSHNRHIHTYFISKFVMKTALESKYMKVFKQCFGKRRAARSRLTLFGFDVGAAIYTLSFVGNCLTSTQQLKRT